jgi:hypothetical protein
MKIWMWSLFVMVVSGGLLWILDLPLVVSMFIIVPVLLYLFIYGSFMYSFRDSLKPELIPPSGYEKRILETENSAKQLPHGFREIDRFYLKTIPDSTTFAFLNENEPVFFCIYHFGKKMGCDVVTLYENGFGLTTNNTVDGGMAPRREKDLIQIFPNAGYERLFQKHMDAHIFLIEKGLRPIYLHPDEFRHRFMQDYTAQGDYIRQFFLWPVILLFRTVLQYGRRYCLTIQEQFNKGQVKIFH